MQGAQHPAMYNLTRNIKTMETYIIVKAPSKRYHIYDGFGDCVTIVSSRMKVYNYLNEVFCPSSCTSYTFKYTAAEGTFIVTMK